ncbi:hypothetical protein [Micromonospora globispora]|uniref:hypothetical protein n=1 Tax=Micromonospora globispora TaxID=1450148 RepID=UPI000F4E64AC|nr:hypothetical protein [Micromonospora globispora]
MTVIDDVFQDRERLHKRDGVAVAVCVGLPIAEDEPALLTGSGRVDGVLAGTARFLQQHDQGAGAVANDSEQSSSVVLEPRLEHSVVDPSPNDVSSLRAGQRRVTILLAPVVIHGSKRYPATRS